MIAIEPMAQDPVVSFTCIKTLVTVKSIEYIGHKISGNYFDFIHKLI